MNSFLFHFLVIGPFLTSSSVAKLNQMTDTFVGEVGASNYTYYRFDDEKNLELDLKLITLEGDADLYVGGKKSRPTFELDQHHFQSTTCGDIDEVIIPSWFVRDERPIGIGVYGHPSHTLSRYILEVTAREVEKDETNGYPEGGDNQPRNRRFSKRDMDDGGEGSHSIISWEVLVSLLAAIARILMEVLT